LKNSAVVVVVIEVAAIAKLIAIATETAITETALALEMVKQCLH
jgi:hypothetical protein